MAGKVITLAQVMAKEMVKYFKCNNNENNDNDTTTKCGCSSLVLIH
jgi:hypothetical protein